MSPARSPATSAPEIDLDDDEGEKPPTRLPEFRVGTANRRSWREALRRPHNGSEDQAGERQVGTPTDTCDNGFTALREARGGPSTSRSHRGLRRERKIVHSRRA